MSRQSRLVFLVGIFIFITLACSTVTQPIEQVKDAASTVESLATAVSVETLMAIPSLLPSEMPNLDLTSMPDVPDLFNPKSAPLKEWNGIPVMPQAIAGEESTDLYVFTVALQPEDVKAFYDETLTGQGWESFSGQGEAEAGSLFLVYQKNDETLSVIVTPSMQGEGILLVMLTKG